MATLDKHKLLYVGFDPYKGVFDDGSGDYVFTNHERFCLAIAYHMLGAYSVDRKRIYLTGFSWGGRLTGEIVPKQPRLFNGGIAVGGCFITLTGGRIIPSYPYARQHTDMVLATGPGFSRNPRRAMPAYPERISKRQCPCSMRRC